MDKYNELKILSMPLVKHLKENWNPHCTIVVTHDSIKVVSDEISVPTKSGQSED